MALQSDLDAATQQLTTSTEATVQATTQLNATVAQLSALNIPVPLNPNALLSAVQSQISANTALGQSVTEAQAAVTAEAAKINPTT